MRRDLAALFCALLMLPATTLAAQKDATGCKDHALFTRMPGYWIHSCRQSQFDSYSFKVAKDRKSAVEGPFWLINYYPNNDLDPKPGDLQILRNFQNAVEQAGGSVVFADRGISTFKLVKQ